ncbi:hypothetical protein JCM9279_007306 [Rhodotorula babjevae]
MTSHGKQLPSGVGIAISLLEGAYVKHNGHTGEAYQHVNSWVWTVTGLLKQHTHDWTDDDWHAVQRELENLTREIPRGGANESAVVPILCALEERAVAERRLEEALFNGAAPREDHHLHSLSRRGAADREQYGSRSSRRY